MSFLSCELQQSRNWFSFPSTSLRTLISALKWWCSNDSRTIFSAWDSSRTERDSSFWHQLCCLCGLNLSIAPYIRWCIAWGPRSGCTKRNGLNSRVPISKDWLDRYCIRRSWLLVWIFTLFLLRCLINLMYKLAELGRVVSLDNGATLVIETSHCPLAIPLHSITRRFISWTLNQSSEALRSRTHLPKQTYISCIKTKTKAHACHYSTHKAIARAWFSRLESPVNYFRYWSFDCFSQIKSARENRRQSSRQTWWS